VFYSKPALTFEQQADQLLGRGLIADRDELIARLKAVNYYRLSGYLYPFRQLPSENFAPGTNLTVVWRRYTFDRRLRLILLDAIERIEVAVRTRLVYHFAQAHGPFGHLDERNLPGFKRVPFAKRFTKAVGNLLKGKGMQVPRSDFRNRLGKLSLETNWANDTFVKHFRSVYGDKHQSLPLWMVSELMSGGTVLDFDDGVASS
jgi:abortive infection bacteriophage resistance protein